MPAACFLCPCRIAFHPSGRFLGTASFDKTWRLWDIETGQELLLQEGHSRAVYSLGFQCDGSLVASCGLDALARVWDLRSGRSVLALEGHVKPLLCVDFSPNGYHLATAGEDHTCRIWDVRKRPAKKSALYTIPAHNALVSQVRRAFLRLCCPSLLFAFPFLSCCSFVSVSPWELA